MAYAGGWKKFEPLWDLVIRAKRVGGMLPMLEAARFVRPVDVRYKSILVWGGLRGALALALDLSLPDSLPLRDTIVVATFGVVAFSIIVQGLTMPLLLRALGFMPQDGA